MIFTTFDEKRRDESFEHFNLKLPTEMEKNLLHSRHFKLSKETFESLQHVYDLYGVQVQALPDNADDIQKNSVLYGTV